MSKARQWKVGRELVSMEKLDYKHLKNCIKFCEREIEKRETSLNWYLIKVSKLKSELRMRDGGGLYDYDDNIPY